MPKLNIKKLESVSFAPAMAFPKTNATAKIPNSIFSGNDTSTEYHSKYNNEKNTVVKKVLATIPYKIGVAVVESHIYDERQNFYHAIMNDGNEAILVVADGTSVGSTYALVEYDSDKKIVGGITNNLYSHTLYKALLAFRLVTKEKEATKSWNAIQEADNIIDSNLKKEFFVTADNIYQLCKEMDGISFTTGDTKLVVKELQTKMNMETIKGIHKYLDNTVSDDGVEASIGSSLLGIDDNIEEMPLPKKKASKKVTGKALVKAIVDGKFKLNNAIDTAWDDTLQDGYKKAQKNFATSDLSHLTQDEAEVIAMMSKGLTTSLGLHGPAGTGKTKFAETISGCIGLPMVVVHGSENLLESDIVGSMELINEGGVSVTGYKARPLVKAYEQGGLVFFDEVNTVSTGVLKILNSILDGNGSFTFGDKVFHQHPNFRFICAWNDGYTGTNQLSPEFKDRLPEKMIISRFSDEKVAAIIEKECGYKNLDIIKKMWAIEAKAEAFINDVGDGSEQLSSVRRVIAWVKRARITGEFVRSACSTIMPDLCSDGAVTSYTTDAFLADSVDEFVPIIMQDIIDNFDDAEFEEDEED